jgi:hypothetical protein
MQGRTATVILSILAVAVLSVFLVDHPMAKRAQQSNVEEGGVRVRSALFRPRNFYSGCRRRYPRAMA